MTAAHLRRVVSAARCAAVCLLCAMASAAAAPTATAIHTGGGLVGIHQAAFVVDSAKSPTVQYGPELKSSKPANDEIVRTRPDTVEMVFDRNITAAVSEMWLDGKRIEMPESPKIEGAKLKLILPKDLPTGDFRVLYAVGDDDGAAASAEFAFAYSTDVKRTAAPSPKPGGVLPALPGSASTSSVPTIRNSTSQNDSGGIPGWVWIVAGAVVLGLALMVSMSSQKPSRRAGRRQA